MTAAGRFWVPYFLGIILWFAYCAAAYAQPTERHGYTRPIPELPGMPPDNWGDAKAHAGYSALMGATGAFIAPKHPWPVFGLCLGVGVIKEYRDRQRGQPGYQHGLFSRNDIKADALGCAAGVGLMQWSRSF